MNKHMQLLKRLNAVFGHYATNVLFGFFLSAQTKKAIQLNISQTT